MLLVCCCSAVAGDGIDIEDDMAVLVRYANGAKMSYHLTAYSPWEVREGMQAPINTKARVVATYARRPLRSREISILGVR